MGRRRLSRMEWLLGGVITVLLAALPWLFSPAVAGANHSHPLSNALHLTSIHSSSTGHGVNDEDFCVTSYTSSIPQATFYDMVRTTLMNGTERWDIPLGDYRIDIWPVTTDCYTLEQSGQDTAVEMKYYAGHPAPPSWCGSSSCAQHYRPSPAVSPKHHNLFVTYMQTAHVPPGNVLEYQRNINHETGHFFGLKDPDQINDFYGGCYSAQGGPGHI